jgi:uncharacterized protein YndB with AHSA1/START domain
MVAIGAGNRAALPYKLPPVPARSELPMTSPRTFETKLQIQALPPVVWKALTDGSELVRWFAPSALCEARVGGRVVWQWGRSHTWTLTVEAVTAGKHLRLRHDSTVDDGAGGKRPLFVDFRLEPRAHGTLLCVEHSGFGPEPAFAAEFESAGSSWPVELRSLRLHLERHRGRDRLLAWSAVSTSLSAEVAWSRLSGPDGLAIAELSLLREGEEFEFEVPGAGKLNGRALFAPNEREFCGVAGNFGGGYFRVRCVAWGGATQVWLWLAAYDGGRAKIQQYQQAFDALLQRLFGDALAAEPQG